jgi:hypothetical protein
MIVLDATLASKLDWEFPEGPLWIHFDFDLENVSLFDPTPLAAFEGALKHFFKTHYDNLADRIMGISLYKGSCHFSTHLEFYSDWLTDNNQIDSPHNRSVHALNILSDYLHRLASLFPDEIEAHALFDMASENNPWHAAQLISKERFTHIALATRNTPVWLTYLSWDESGVYERENPTLAVVLPVDSCFAKFPIPQITDTYRMIPEYALTEMWDGVDTLYYMEEALSSLGRRKLLGFEAAAGKTEKIPVN